MVVLELRYSHKLELPLPNFTSLLPTKRWLIFHSVKFYPWSHCSHAGAGLSIHLMYSHITLHHPPDLCSDVLHFEYIEHCIISICTLHIWHYTLQSAHYSLDTAHFKLHSKHLTLHISSCTLDTHISSCLLDSAHFKLHTWQCTFQASHCTLDSAHFKLHTAHLTLHSWSVLACHSSTLGILSLFVGQESDTCYWALTIWMVISYPQFIMLDKKLTPVTDLIYYWYSSMVRGWKMKLWQIFLCPILSPLHNFFPQTQCLWG